MGVNSYTNRYLCKFYVGVLRVYMLHWLGAGVTRFSQRKYLALENDEEELVQIM